MKIYHALIYLMLLNSCFTNTAEKLNCLNEINMNNWREVESISVLVNSLNDSIKKWEDSGYVIKRHNSNYLTRIDSFIYFNTTKDAAMFVLLKQAIDSNLVMDDIQLIYGKIINSKWHFYYNGLHAISMWRSENKIPFMPYTFDQISQRARLRLIEGGYLKNNCEINDEWVNGWYSNTMEKDHTRFLNEVR